LNLRSRSGLAAENLFLRKQLALYVERKKKPRRATDSIRFTLCQSSRFFHWSDALTVVKPGTLVRWHRQGFRIFWKWKSRSPGRPRVPANVRRLIVEMAVNNLNWGEERIADELLLKMGIRISPRTVRRYMPKSPKRPADPSQRWTTFVRNHAKAIVASDFFVVATTTFRLVYVFVIMEVGSRRILHFNVTQHPTAEWTAHYNRGRPHSRLGPGVPEFAFRRIEYQVERHNVPDNHRVVAIPILGGLHHEYRLEKIAA